MSDYSFLKSGSLVYRERVYNIEEIIQSILIILVEGAFKKLINFCNHRGLYNDNSQIPLTIVQIFLRIETMIFLETPNLNERIQQVLSEVHSIMENFDEYLLETTNEIDLRENNPVEYCNCNDCEIVLNIDNIWENFNPSDGFLLLLKQKIDDIDLRLFL